MQNELHKQEKEDFLSQFERLKEEAKTSQLELENKYETQILFITR